MIKFDCTVNCGTDNAAFPEILGKVQNFENFNYRFDNKTMTVKGVTEQKTFISFLTLLDQYKFKAKCKKKFAN